MPSSLCLLLLGVVSAAPPAEIDGVPLAVVQEIFQVEVLRLPAAALTRWIADPDPDVRRRAALALGRLREPKEAASLLAAMAMDPDAGVRREAVFALGQTAETASVLAGLWGRERDDRVRAAVAVALGKQGGPEAIPLLLDGLGSHVEAISAASAEALGRLGMRKVGEAGTETVAAHLVERIGLPVGETRRRAAWALGRMGLTHASAATVERLRDVALRDPDANVRAWVIRAWAAVAANPDRVAGLALAARDESTGVRIAAARALAKQCEPASEEPLAGLLRDPQEAVRLEAIAAFGTCPNRNAATLLAPALASEEPRVRAAAVTALSTAGALPGSIDPWLDASQPLPVRGAAVRTLTDRARLLDLALRAPEPPLRSAATETLLALPSRKVADLVALLDSADPVVATAAADTLRESPDAAAERALLARLAKGDLDEPSGGTFVAALAALYTTGKIRDAAPDAARVLAPWLTVPALAADAARIAPVLRLPLPSPGHPDRRVPSLDEVLQIRSARLLTDEGEIRISLAPEEAPYTVWNFATLAEKGYFDGVSFHRVVPDFVIQAGDPRGDGWGGPGYAIPDEINALPYDDGAVGMALSGPDTGGSQWFITTSPQPHLEGTYTVFGHVTYGLRNARAIGQGDVIRTIRIERVK